MTRKEDFTGISGVEGAVLIKMAHERCKIYIGGALAAVYLSQSEEGEDGLQTQSLLHVLGLLSREFDMLEEILEKQVTCSSLQEYQKAE